MGRVNIFVPHKCPLCHKEHDLLTYYDSKVDSTEYLEPEDIILLNEGMKLGFIVVEGYCDEKDSLYYCKVGINKSRITSIVQPC